MYKYKRHSGYSNSNYYRYNILQTKYGSQGLKMTYDVRAVHSLVPHKCFCVNQHILMPLIHVLSYALTEKVERKWTKHRLLQVLLLLCLL